MGADGPRPGAEISLRTLKPPPDRLYGRSRGHRLRDRQEDLLAHTLPRLLLDPAAPLHAFAGYRAVSLEIGFGGGEHALAQARAHPDTALIACEVFVNGICSLLSALVGEAAPSQAPLPANLRLYTDDARLLLQALPPACLDGVFLLFPDPWPKARHAKRRFVHPAVVSQLARVLKPGAEWRIASDDPVYQAWVATVMGADTVTPGLFTAVGDPQATRPDAWPPTRYEAKALRAGRYPLYWTFRRTSGTQGCS